MRVVSRVGTTMVGHLPTRAKFPFKYVPPFRPPLVDSNLGTNDGLARTYFCFSLYDFVGT